MSDRSTDWSTFWEMVKDTRFAMFTARHGEGQLRSRPMTTLNGANDRADVLWFFMSKSSEPVFDIARDAEVNVSYANPAKDTYVSVSGRARIVEDAGLKKKFWNPGAQAWFSGGASDPDVALIAVTIEQAEFWDVRTNKAEKIYELAKAAMTGTRPNLGEHREVRHS
jgi:general stress protein 26